MTTIKKILSKKFIDTRQKLDDKNYLISTIAYNIAPTAEGQKPSSLITFNSTNRNLHKLWNQYKYLFANDASIQYYEIKNEADHTLVLFYNPEMLYDTIFQAANIEFLKRFQYNETMTLDESLALLKERFADVCPHEIGIFLGFPQEDVKCFIEHKGQNCLLCGYWKVYTNVEHAKKTFHAYDQAKERVLAEMERLL